MKPTNRRTFIRQMASLGFVFTGIPDIFWHEHSSDFPIVIKNGKSFINDKWQTLDIGITENGKLNISSTSLSGKFVIDASNKIVSPGFIDILSGSFITTKKAYLVYEKYKLADGVTTALQMHGGTREVNKFYTGYQQLPHWINYGVSAMVMKVRYKYNDLKERYRQIEQCLDEGALGVSHSIEYQPTPWDELVEYARLAKKYDRPMFLHLRYSSEEKELNGVDEAIKLANVTGARIHIDHLHSTGGTFHMTSALRKIRDAVDSGLQITICVYPYTYWATYLHSTRFGPGWQKRYGLTYNDLEIVGTGEHLTKQTFEKYRAQPGILVAVPPGTMPHETTLDLALKEDFCLVGSDGGIVSEPHANNHPRGAGCFSTAVRHALSISMPLEKILEKFTRLPREVLNPALDRRGILRDGANADLTIFDPGHIDGSATVANPNQFSKGINTVIVNGAIAYHQGELQRQNGEPVRLNSKSQIPNDK